MDRQDIIERVKIIMDEYTPVNQGVVHPLDGYIDPIMDDSVRTLFKEFPIDKLWHERITTVDVLNIVTNHVKVRISNDVVRVASAKLADWTRLVHEREFEKPDSVKVAWQGNEATKATASRPVVVMGNSETGRILDLYGRTGASSATTEVYGVKRCKPEELNDDLITPFTYLVAFLLATHIERADIAKPIYEQYLKHLQ